jgi:hypothetical protein
VTSDWFITTPYVVSGIQGLKSLGDVMSRHGVSCKLGGDLKGLTDFVDRNVKEIRVELFIVDGFTIGVATSILGLSS